MCFIFAFQVSSDRPSMLLAASAAEPRGLSGPGVIFKFRSPNFHRQVPGRHESLRLLGNSLETDMI